MKKILLLASGAFILTASTFAQTKPINDSAMKTHRRANVQKIDRQYSKELQLTDAQKEQIKLQREALQKETKAVQNDATLTPEQKRAKMQEIQKASREKYNSVLTAEQRATMKNRMEQRKSGENRPAHSMKGKRKYAVKKMDHLKLTPEQQARMDKQKTQYKEQANAIKNNDKLTDAQKKEKLSDLRKKRQEDFNKSLTPEQKEKMKERAEKVRDHKKNQSDKK